MKKIAAILVALTLGITLLGCSQTDEVKLESSEELFTLQALSSTSLLSYSDNTTQELAFVPLSEVEETEDPVITEEVDNIDYYIEMMELFLGDDNLTVETQESDDEAYSYMTVYNTKNIRGEEVTYTFYYNEFELTENEELAPEGFNENTEAVQGHKFAFNDEDDNLAVLGLEGILVYGDLTYNIEGKKIVNSQQEIYRLRSFIDEENYVLVNYQNDVTDRDREKFFFKSVEDGIVVSESKVMMFNKDNRLHLKLEFIEGEDYANYTFNIRTIDEKEYIHIVYEIKNGDVTEEGSVKLTAELDPETGEVIYSYDMSPSRAQKGYRNEYRHRNNRGENMPNENTGNRR